MQPYHRQLEDYFVPLLRFFAEIVSKWLVIGRRVK
jgi:hypothetical protein